MRGKTVREFRKQRAWSQVHLAEAAGVSVRTIQRLERDGHASDETMLSVAAALDIDVQELTSVVPVSAKTPGNHARALWRTVSPKQSFVWGGLLLIPPLLFILSNVMKYEMNLPQLYDALAAMGETTGLTALSPYFTSPALLLGAPFMALLLGLMAQIRISGEDTVHGFSLRDLTISFNPKSLSIIIGAIVGIACLIGYITMENISEWIIELVEP